MAAPNPKEPAAETSPSEWKYLNEGGANVVYAFGDPLHPRYGQMVLRVPKAADKPDSVFECEGEQQRKAQQAFEKVILPALVDEEFLVERRKVTLPSAWLRELEDLTEESRPSHRRHAQRSSTTAEPVDAPGTTAELLANLIGGQAVLAVEIKPKWGFLPNPRCLSDASRPIKTRHCRFCMHRHLRNSARQAEVVGGPPSSRRSKADNHLGSADSGNGGGYCPLDLYSGRTDRVLKAVEALWQGYTGTGGLGNNLRLYVDGKQVSPAEEAGNVPSDAIKSALIDTFSTSFVLRRLSMLQRRLDLVDVEGIVKMLLGEAPSPEAEQGMSLDVRSADRLLEEPSTEELLQLMKKLRGHFHIGGVAAGGSAVWTTRDHVLAYLLSATFKDCSLIVRFGLDLGDADGTDKPASLSRMAIKVIDLDLKPLSKFWKWAELDRQIWTAYAERLEREGQDRVCVEQTIPEVTLRSL